MRTLAAEKKLVTQMGNQGTADNGFRSGVELLRSGVLGPIKEILVWTNRPIWPQGMPRPKDTPGIPNNVRWYEFLGPAHDRPYHPELPAVQLARLAGLRHRRPRRHGLPHDQHRLHGARAVRPRVGRGRRYLGDRRQRQLSRSGRSSGPSSARATAAAR